VRRFGPAAEVAAAFDLEVAAGRGLRSTAVTAAALAVVQALALRRGPAAPGDVRLLARRNACAVAAAAATMFAAGAALPGHGSAALLLAGPLLLLAATAGALRTGRLSRRIAGATGVPVRAPLDDLRRSPASRCRPVRVATADHDRVARRRSGVRPRPAPSTPRSAVH
jgi:hypothetical protein